MALTRTTHVQPKPIVTLDEVDEALWWTSHQRDRNAQWHRWLDALLDERNRIAATANQHTNQPAPSLSETEPGT